MSIQNSRWRSNAVLTISGMVIGLILSEALLRIFTPCPYPATIGHTRSANASLYGWGYGPGERITIVNPDTGGTFTSVANSRGWRDKERKPGKLPGTYRILVVGDSITFGIVPAEKTYSRILEDKLTGVGYKAEVINISYGGWGTDQELEALIHDGVQYKPDLIVLQFGDNDITDNLYYNFQERNNSKPFYYVLNAQGALLRYPNPLFKTSSDSMPSLKEKLKLVVFQSEICKCLYRLRLSLQFSETLSVTGAVYKPTLRNIVRLQMILDTAKVSEAFWEYLYKNIDTPLPKTDLEKVIASSQLGTYRERIMRVLEDRFFDRNWRVDSFYPPAPDKRSLGWRLYFKLVEEIQRIAAQHGAKLLLFSPEDLGKYEFQTYWFVVANDDETRSRSSQLNDLLSDFAKQRGIGFIPLKRRYVRWQYDAHPNVAGNEAMASDIFDYLTTDFAHELMAFRTGKHPHPPYETGRSRNPAASHKSQGAAISLQQNPEL